MTNGTEKSGWTQLSNSFADTIADLENSIVAIEGGRGSTASGVVWRPGVIVTTHHGLRLRENIKIILAGESLSARWIGSDATTDLAVLGTDSDKLTPVSSANNLVIRAGEVVLSVGRSRLGDISASCGIIARTGRAWRSWRGGAIDSLIRPDIRLYVGQSGSALVNEQRQVLARRWVSVHTQWGEVRVKIASMNGTVTNYAPEYEDCRRIAAESRVPLKNIMQEAARAYLQTRKTA